MRAMILAAGRGERLRPLTDDRPKPLVDVRGKPIIVHLIEQLARAGIRDLVINHSWLGEQLVRRLGDGATWQVRIAWSAETTALETAGGIANARHLLGNEAFLVVNGDIFTDFDFSLARPWSARLVRMNLLGIGVLVANPPHNASGDFSLQDDLASNDEPRDLTWAGITVMSPALIESVAPGTRAPLAPLLRIAAAQRRLGGQRHDGLWSDVGTFARLQALNQPDPSESSHRAQT